VKRASWVPTLAALAVSTCQPYQAATADGAARLEPGQGAVIADSVRAFAESVALGVTARGPAAWRTYFADEPAFFMASEGRLVFPNSDAATRAIDALTHTIAHIELRWGAALRVDPLAPGLAILAAPYHETQIDAQRRRVEEDGFFTGLVEHRARGWQFRDAHWSVITPPAAVP
jgi:hypothetical protein